MDFFPNFGRPYYYNRYINPAYRNPYINADKTGEEQKRPSREEEQDRLKKDTKEKGEEPVFEIFGLKLYFDDVLIIALIFFLYNEGVRDNLLFISLILILLS